MQQSIKLFMLVFLFCVFITNYTNGFRRSWITTDVTRLEGRRNLFPPTYATFIANSLFFTKNIFKTKNTPTSKESYDLFPAKHELC